MDFSKQTKVCSRCYNIPNKGNTISLLGSGGDYEIFPCPQCNKKEFERIMNTGCGCEDGEAD